MAGTNNALNNSSSTFTVGNLNLNGNTLSSLSGNIQLTPVSGGNVQATLAGGGSFQAIDGVAGETCLIEALNTNNSNASSDAFIRARTGGSSGGSGYLGVNNSAGNSFSWGFAAASPTLLKESLGTPGGTLLRQMTSDGIQTLPLQPIFSATLTSAVSNATGDGTDYTVIFDTELEDRNNDFNLGTSTFTAPVAGTYLFHLNLQMGSVTTSHTSGYCQIVTTGKTFNGSVSNVGAMQAGGQTSLECTAQAVMTVGQTCTFLVNINGSTKTCSVGGSGTCYCSGYLIG